ncbi:MAG: hypothetical protein H6R01_515 [Burkholderiaceae bacterium]|nr:hypothetical protein [Burkholderiaceae bacterium]
MKLGKLWNPKKDVAGTGDHPGTAPARAAPPAPLPPVPQADVDALFRTWLFNDITDGKPANSTAEHGVLHALDRLVSSMHFGSHLVPRQPDVLPQLIVALHDQQTSTAQLAAKIGQDASLIAETIRDANSPAYHPTSRITSLDKAIMVLGNKGLRMTVAKAFLRPIIDTRAGPLARRASPLLWAQTEQCATACCMLAGAHRVDPFDAFLAGLLKNLGTTIVLRVIDQFVHDAHAIYSEAFCHKAEGMALKLSANIAALWQMPATICNALLEASPTEASNQSALGMTVQTSDRLSKLALLIRHQRIDEAAIEGWGMSEAEWHYCQKLVAAEKPAS